MVEKIKCEKCRKEIKPEEIRVTYEEHSIKPMQIDLKIDMHRQCWIDNYNNSIDKKCQYMAKQIMKNAQPMIKEFAGKYGGLTA